jgi:hypothetical protein
MVAANGVPIRLVQENGGLIELDATSITLTTSRKAGGMAVPFSGGQRFGLDMNMQKAIVIVHGVFTDDKEIVGTDSLASSIVDFTSVYPVGWANATISFIDGPTNITRNNLANLFNTQNTYDSSGDTYSLTILRLAASNGTKFTISFKKLTSGTVTNTTNGSYVMGINPDSSSITATVLRDGFISLINNEPTLAAVFTATAIDSTIKQVAGAVKISQDVAGKAGNNVTPDWKYLGAGFSAPYTSDFVGGRTVVKKSAGDKAMDLYGLMNNMKRTGAGKIVTGGLMALTGGVASVALASTGVGVVGIGMTGGIAATGVGMMLEGTGMGSDYIIGIQIPYNSTIQSDGKTYVARNFIMPTGWGKSPTDKSSAGNTLVASADLTKDGNRAGIKGVVQKLDITYEAGENVYGFVMNFIPVDRSI